MFALLVAAPPPWTAPLPGRGGVLQFSVAVCAAVWACVGPTWWHAPYARYQHPVFFTLCSLHCVLHAVFFIENIKSANQYKQLDTLCFSHYVLHTVFTQCSVPAHGCFLPAHGCVFSSAALLVVCVWRSVSCTGSPGVPPVTVFCCWCSRHTQWPLSYPMLGPLTSGARVQCWPLACWHSWLLYVCMWPWWCAACTALCA